MVDGNTLQSIFLNKSNWDKEVKLSGETWIYNSEENELRRKSQTVSRGVFVLVGYITNGEAVVFR